MKTISPEARARIVNALCRATRGVVSTTLAAGDGTPLGPDDRTEMLRRAVLREDVAVVIRVLAYEQERGKPNRNFVRFADAAMGALGSSGKETIYLRDHNQWSSECVQGRVLESAATELAPGHWQVHQTIEVTEPAAVERILRGLMRAVSIGWRSRGPIVCTACHETIDDDCYGHSHYPGQEVEIEDQTVVCEYEFQTAELVETSEVPIGGVPTAELEEIRAALSAAHGTAPGNPTNQRTNMKTLRETLASKYKLAESATEAEVIAAADALTAAVAKLKEEVAAREAELAAEKKKTEAKEEELEAKDAELSIVRQDRSRMTVELQAFRAAAGQAEEDKVITEALAVGKISLGEESLFRRFHKADKAGCLAEIAGRAENAATPVGAPRQSDKPAPIVAAPTQLSGAVAKGLQQHGLDPALTLKLAKGFGAKNPEKTLADAMGIKQEG